MNDRDRVELNRLIEARLSAYLDPIAASNPPSRARRRAARRAKGESWKARVGVDVAFPYFSSVLGVSVISLLAGGVIVVLGASGEEATIFETICFAGFTGGFGACCGLLAGFRLGDAG